MKYVSTLVSPSGPPWVSRSIWPNVWKAKIEPITTAKKIVGDSIGSVTCQNRDHAGAVDACRFEQLVGYALQACRHQDEGEAERLPHVVTATAIRAPRRVLQDRRVGGDAQPREQARPAGSSACRR